jgi:hypothetical protein
MKIKRLSQKLYFDTKSIRNKIMCVLIGSMVFTTLLIVISPDEKKYVVFHN